MEDLSAKLDKEDPGWRGHTVMVMDNATPHTGADIQKVISDLKLPVFYTSPASFNALPVELWFSIVKRKFNVTHKEAMEKHAKEKEEGRETKLVDLRVRAIDSAIQMTPRTLTKKCFIR
jgi:transposase